MEETKRKRNNRRPLENRLTLFTGLDEQTLGTPMYDAWKHKRNLDSGIGGITIGKWKTWHGDEWPPERIIAYYDPSTWAEDGCYGYRTPIYMLNRIIRLQTVMEIAGNRIDATLNTIVTEQDKLRTAVYQNRLALDYLLASEGGVCGKFNLTNRCLQINPVRKVVTDLTADLRKIIHVPVQKWSGIIERNGFPGGIFRNWKQAAFMAGVIFIGLMMLPLIRNIVQSSIESVISSQKSIKSIMIMKEIEDELKLLQNEKINDEERCKLLEIKS